MTRVYFEKEGFTNFHRAYVYKQDLRKKHNVYCKIVEDGNTVLLKVTSLNEKSQNLLRELGFKEVGKGTL